MATETTGKTSEITIFLRGGSTLMFYDCEIISAYGIQNGNIDPCDIVFTYISRSTKKKKKALFCTSIIAGFSQDINDG